MCLLFFFKKCDFLVCFFYGSLFLLYCSPTKKGVFCFGNYIFNRLYACRIFSLIQRRIHETIDGWGEQGSIPGGNT